MFGKKKNHKISWRELEQSVEISVESLAAKQNQIDLARAAAGLRPMQELPAQAIKPSLTDMMAATMANTTTKKYIEDAFGISGNPYGGYTTTTTATGPTTTWTTGTVTWGSAYTSAPITYGGGIVTGIEVYSDGELKQKEETPKMSNKEIWALIKMALRTGENLLLYGPPGTGKTYSAHEYAKEIEKQLYVQNMTEELLAAQMLGHFVPNEGGGLEWMDGPIIAAMRRGCIVLINEIDRHSPDAESFLHFACDGKDVACVTLPNKKKERITPAEGYQVIATMNGMPEDLGYALNDRFVIKIRVDEPNPAAVASLPEDLRAFATKTTGEANKGSPSIRGLKAVARIREQFDVDTAAKLVFAHRASEFLKAIKISDEPK